MLGMIVGTMYGVLEMQVVMHGFGEVMYTPSKRYTSYLLSVSKRFVYYGSVVFIKPRLTCWYFVMLMCVGCRKNWSESVKESYEF